MAAPPGLLIMRIRADPAGDAAARIELAALAPAHQPRVWTDTLVDLLLGRSPLDPAFAEADAATTGQLRAGQRCEANGYVAERRLLAAKSRAR